MAVRSTLPWPLRWVLAAMGVFLVQKTAQFGQDSLLAGPLDETASGYGLLARVEDLVARNKGGKAFVTLAEGESLCAPSLVQGGGVMRLAGQDGSDLKQLVEAILAVASHLQLKVVAEGVETASQLSFLQTHKCDEYQGFLTSRAVMPDEFETLLASQTALGRVGEADDVGCMIAGLLSDDHRWVNAQNIEVAGGYII